MEIKIYRPNKLKRWRLQVDREWMGKHVQIAALYVDLMRFLSLKLGDKKARIGIYSGSILENETTASNDTKYLGYALLAFLEDDVSTPFWAEQYKKYNHAVPTDWEALDA